MNTIKKLVFSLVVMIFAVLSFSSCDKSVDDVIDVRKEEIKESRSIEDDFISDSVTVEELFLEQASNSFLKSVTRSSTLPSGWVELFPNHPDGLRCLGKMTDDGRTWVVFKVYLPKIKITPVYRIHGSSNNANNPTFYKQPVRDWYNSQEGKGSLASVNASFFNLDPSYLNAANPIGYGIKGDRAELAHALGYANKYISRGYSPTEFGVRYLRTHQGKAFISSAQSTGSFELLVGGYDPVEVNKDANLKKGRTMIGIPYDGSDIVYIFCTGAQGGAKQAEVVSALSSFGCSKVVMLDGSGSSQATWANYFRLVSSEDPIINRNVPIVLRMDRR